MLDLHDRCRELVQETERRHSQVRRPSLTGIIIGLLEGGPADVDGAAGVMVARFATEGTEEAPR